MSRTIVAGTYLFRLFVQDGLVELSSFPVMDRMTLLLDKAMATASALPPAVQDEIALVVMEMAGVDRPVYVYSAEEDARLDESEAAAARGAFATDEEVRAIWAKHGL